MRGIRIASDVALLASDASGGAVARSVWHIATIDFVGLLHNGMHHSNLGAYIGAVIAIIVIFAALRNRRR